MNYILKNVIILVFIIKGSYQDSVNITNCDEDKHFPSGSIGVQPIWKDESQAGLRYNYKWRYELTRQAPEPETMDVASWLHPMKHDTYKLIIPSYKLSKGRYELKIFAERKPGITEGPESPFSEQPKKCTLIVENEPPVAVISGGDQQLVEANKDFTVSGEESYDPNVERKSFKSLKFTWKCECWTGILQRCPYCWRNKIISTDPKFTIPAKELNTTYRIILTLNLEGPDGQKAKPVKQTLYSISNVAELSLRCVENCGSSKKFNCDLPLRFKVSCISKCKDVTDKNYGWTITKKNNGQFAFDFEKSSSGRIGSELLIKERSLESGEIFQVTVNMKTQSARGFAGIDLECEPPVHVTKCEIIPKKGDIFTIFRLKCANPPDDSNLFYKLLMKEKGKAEELVTSGDPYEFEDKEFELPLSEGKTFFVRVTQPNQPSKDLELQVTVLLPPEINVKKCEVVPNQGNAINTLFRLKCDNPQEKTLVYTLLIKDDEGEKEVISGAYSTIENQKFKLPLSRGRTFFVRLTQPKRLPKELPVQATIQPSLKDKPPDEVANLLQNIYNGSTPKDSLSNMIASDDPKRRAEAIDKFKGMVEEMEHINTRNKNFDEFVEQLKYAAAEDMAKISVDNLHQSLAVSNSITKLAAFNTSAELDPLLSKMVTDVCKKVMDKSLLLIKQEENRTALAETSMTLTKSINECMEPHSDPHFNIIAPIHHDVVTEEPIFDVPMVTENYPNYVDHDESYYKKLDFLRDSSSNMINSTAAAAKTLAMTSEIGGGLVTSATKSSETVVAKDTGDALTKIRLRSQGVMLLASKDFENDNHPYDILMITWSKDILWWNPGQIQVSTDIVSCEFWHSTCKERILSFKQPISLFFNVKNESRVVSAKIQTFTIPKNYSFFSDEQLNYVIRVHRFALAPGVHFYVEFQNLSSGDSFQVVYTMDWFPTIRDFKKNYTVNATQNAPFQMPNTNDHYVHIYVGLLVDRTIAEKNTHVNYALNSMTKSCIQWVNDSSRWESVCKPGRRARIDRIHCECTHLSVIAGYVANLESTIQAVLIPGLELKLQSHFIIFITLLATITIYLFLLLFTLFGTKHQVYFLADNHRKHRFAYLVVIKTGMGLNSGTSSNVTIKLIGDVRTSEPHVLNYPDPKMRVLQSFGNDSFLLATERHLGNLKQIELWFDSIGPNPTWYCREITVYDMQQHLEWHFDVRKKLSILKGVTRIVVEPTVNEQDKNKVPANKPDLEIVPKPRTGFGTKCKNTCKFRCSLKNHTWFLWQHEGNYSYIKKITVILSNVLTMYAVDLFLYGLPKLELQDGIDKHSEYSVGLTTVFLAFLSSFPPFLLHFAIAWCFRFSKVQLSRYEQDAKLGFGCTAFCWTLLIILITSSTVFLVFFGFWCPTISSYIWLTSCGIGLALNMMVYEILFISFQELCCKAKMGSNIRRRFHDIWSAVEIQRKYLYEEYGESLLRPYFKRLYLPLRRQDIKRKTITLRQRYGVISELEDLFMFGVYVIFLYLVVLVNKDPLVVLGKQNMMNLMEGDHSRTIDFNEIHTFKNIYDYLNMTLIPSIQPTRWYGNYVSSEPGLMLDMSNKYIGVARLRQHRTIANSCEVPEIMKFLNLSCWPEFDMLHSETGKFGYNWEAYSAFMEFDRLHNIWKYSSAEITETLFSFGAFATYSGGGYVAYLGRTLYNSIANFRKILEKLWIDEETRVIFIEFLTYNANYNIFTAIQLMLEQSAAGLINKRIQAYTVRMLFVQNEFESISVILFLFFAIWVVMLFMKSSLGLVKKAKSFYKDVWFMIDLIIILMSVGCIVLFVLRMSFVGQYLSIMETKKHNEFISYFYLFYIEDILTFVAAFLVCIATIRLWKFLRFAIVFRMLERTLAISAAPLASFAFVYFIAVLGFGMTIVLLVGNYFQIIHTIPQITRLLMTFALRAGEIKLKQYIPHRLTLTVLIIYGIILKISIVIFIMLIIMSYSASQLEFSSQVDTYNIKHYVREKLRYFPKFIRYKCKRLKAGQTAIKVEPKSDKFLYVDSFKILSFRMIRMKYITKCILRNKNQFKPTILTESDVQMMNTVCRLLFEDDIDHEVEVFFIAHTKGKVKFVDEKHIEKIANATNLLLQEQEPIWFRQEIRDPIFEQCGEHIRRNRRTLKRCNAHLKILLHKMNAVEIEFAKEIG